MTQTTNATVNLAELDIDLSEIKSSERLVLYIIYNREPITKNEIAAASGMSKGFTGNTINRLKREGLIEPIPNPAEPRSFQYVPQVDA